MAPNCLQKQATAPQTEGIPHFLDPNQAVLLTSPTPQQEVHRDDSKHLYRPDALHLNSGCRHSVRVVPVLPLRRLFQDHSLLLVPSAVCSLPWRHVCLLSPYLLGPCWHFHVHTANLLSRGSPHRGFPPERKMWFGPEFYPPRRQNQSQVFNTVLFPVWLQGCHHPTCGTSELCQPQLSSCLKPCYNVLGSLTRHH